MTGAFDAIYTIVQRGRGKEIARLSRTMGALGGLSMEAEGTVTNEMMGLLGLESKEKTIVEVLSRREHTLPIMREIAKEFTMHKVGHGIAFSVPIIAAKGLNAMFRLRDKYADPVDAPEEVEEASKMDREYVLITVIVKSGYADEAMQAARTAGAEGGTILHGRGMSIRENVTLFGVAIQPEKDVLLCVVPKEICQGVMNSVTLSVGLDKPGQGIVYAVPVTNVMGIAHGLAPEANLERPAAE